MFKPVGRSIPLYLHFFFRRAKDGFLDTKEKDIEFIIKQNTVKDDQPDNLDRTEQKRYIDEYLDPVLRPLIKANLKDREEEVFDFSLAWLEKTYKTDDTIWKEWIRFYRARKDKYIKNFFEQKLKDLKRENLRLKKVDQEINQFQLGKENQLKVTEQMIKSRRAEDVSDLEELRQN